jgi:hypothetical protein
MKDDSKIKVLPGLVKIFIITISDRYARVQGNPHRILAIPSTFTLYKFAEVILESFNFNFDHCFGFYDNLKNIYNSHEGYELFKDIGEESDFKSVKKNKIDIVFDSIGKKMCFMFDYGDEWRFIVELKDEIEVSNTKHYPKVIESKGKAPKQYQNYNEDY